jgi:homoserine dehydrogenase
VVIESGFADQQFFYGKGAGSFPTASAVLSDIAALRYQYKYEYKKLYHHQPSELTNDYYLRVFLSADEWSHIPLQQFEWIDESYAAVNRSYITGVIHYSKLINSSWWKQNNVSLILDAQPIIESHELNEIRPEKAIQFLEQVLEN